METEAGRIPLPILRAWVVASTAVLALVVAEFGIDILRPAKPVGSQHPYVNQYVRKEEPLSHAVTTLPEAGLSGLSGPNRFSTNDVGFRGGELVRPKPADTYRVFLVGGSTTECFYVDNGDSIDAVLEARLGEGLPTGRTIEVFNAGVSGAASDDHVAMIGQRIAHLEPDLVVVWAGINDLMRSIYGTDPLHRVERLPERRYSVLGTFKRLRSVSFVFRKLRKNDARPLTILTSQGRASNYARKVALQAQAPTVEGLPRTDPLTFRNNLLTIVGMAQGHGFDLVLMTQPSTWNSRVDETASTWHWMRLRNGVTYSEEAMDEALESLNDVTRSIATEYDLALLDLARQLPKSLEHFYDDCHLNTRGSRTVGSMLARLLGDEVSSAGVPTADASLSEAAWKGVQPEAARAAGFSEER